MSADLAQRPGRSWTSIRVSIDTRDALAAEAARAGMSLGRYLDHTVRQAERDRLFAAYRRAVTTAHDDPAFAAEMRDWDDADDGIDFGAEEWLGEKAA